MKDIIILSVVIIIVFAYFGDDNTPTTDQPLDVTKFKKRVGDIKEPIDFSKFKRIDNEQETLNDILVCSSLFVIAEEKQHVMAMLVSMLTLVEKNKNLIIPKEKEAKEAVNKALNLARAFVRNPNATKKELALFSIGTNECTDHAIMGALDVIGRRAKGDI